MTGPRLEVFSALGEAATTQAERMYLYTQGGEDFWAAMLVGGDEPTPQ